MSGWAKNFLFLLIFFAVSFVVGKWFKGGEGDVPRNAVRTENVPAWQRFSVVPSGDHYRVRAGFTVLKRCFLGEIQLAEMDRAHGIPGKYLFSLEPLMPNAGGLKLPARPLSTLELSVGLVSAEFEVPKKTPPANLGFFLCSDVSGEGRCNGKPFGRLDESMVVLAKSDADKPADCIYAFQYVHWNGDGSFEMLKGRAPKPEAFDAALRTLSSVSPESLPRAQSLLSILAPLPIRVESGRPMLTLTNYAKETCGEL